MTSIADIERLRNEMHAAEDFEHECLIRLRNARSSDARRLKQMWLAAHEDLGVAKAEYELALAETRA